MGSISMLESYLLIFDGKLLTDNFISARINANARLVKRRLTPIQPCEAVIVSSVGYKQRG